MIIIKVNNTDNKVTPIIEEIMNFLRSGKLINSLKSLSSLSSKKIGAPIVGTKD